MVYGRLIMANVEKVNYGKRPKLDVDGILNHNHSIFIVPVKFSKARLKLLKDICKSKSLQVAEQFSDSVTHIVTKFDTRDKVYQYLKRASLGTVEIVNDAWLTACLTQCRLLDVVDKHRIEPHLLCKSSDNIERISSNKHSSDATPNIDHFPYQDTKYECQRRTPLNHHNKKFTEALEILEKHASYIDREHGESRALAFRKASCALKSYPREITRIDEISKITHVGEHSLRVITDILENGYSEEVQDIISSEMFHVIELFTGIYGCGPSTAHKWYGLGHRTTQDIKNNAEILNLNVQQKYGVEFYDDLNAPVGMSDALRIQRLVVEQLDLIQPSCSAEIVGGFGRGKQCGHDIDILISHPEEDKVEGLLVKLVDRLTTLGCMLHTALSVGKNVARKETFVKTKAAQTRSTMDNLDRCFAIMKVEKSADDNDSCNSWIARRVDLIITPSSQYAFSLLGWIGSKQFNRSLRLYTWKEMKIHLNSHGMWDHKSTKFINTIFLGYLWFTWRVVAKIAFCNKLQWLVLSTFRGKTLRQEPPKRILATDEEEIFKALHLDFVERKDRNC